MSVHKFYPLKALISLEQVNTTKCSGKNNLKTAMIGSAYYLHGNFGGKFLSNGTGIFLAPKTGTGLSCTIYKIPVKFPLSQDMEPGTSNPNKWYRKFRSFW